MKNIPRSFHLIVCIICILFLLSCAGTRTRESTGEYVDDAAITTKVKSALLADQGLSGLSISVETFKGRVQLSGFVNSAEQMERAVKVAQGVSGVRAVENKLSIK